MARTSSPSGVGRVSVTGGLASATVDLGAAAPGDVPSYSVATMVQLELAIR